MRIKNHLFWLCFTGMLCLITGVVFLPRYISRSLDFREMNQVEISKREDFSFLEQGSNDTAEAARAFLSLGQEEGNPVLLTSIEEPIQMSSELLENLYHQALLASELGMIPRLVEYRNISQDYNVYTKVGEEVASPVLSWTEYMQFARYYSLTYEAKENPNKKELLNFWYLNFSDGTIFDYYFVINAVTSEIYYAEIHNAATQSWIQNEEDLRGEASLVSEEYDAYVGYLAEEYAAGCGNYYQATGYESIGQKNLYQKLNLAILYFEDGQPVYIERSIVEGKNEHIYRGISVGLQNLVNWIRAMKENES